MLYATLSDSFAHKLPFLASPFRFLGHLLGDEVHSIPKSEDGRDPGELSHEFIEKAGERRIEETSAPFRALVSGVQSIFSLYKKEGDGFIRREQILRDLFQPLIGILNVVRGALGLLVGLLVALVLLVVPIIPLALYTLFCTKAKHRRYNYAHAADAWTKYGRLLSNTLGWIIQGFGQLLHGATQIVFAPLTWLSMLVRGPLTALASTESVIQPDGDNPKSHWYYDNSNNHVVGMSQTKGATQQQAYQPGQQAYQSGGYHGYHGGGAPYANAQQQQAYQPVYQPVVSGGYGYQAPYVNAPQQPVVSASLAEGGSSQQPVYLPAYHYGQPPQ